MEFENLSIEAFKIIDRESVEFQGRSPVHYLKMIKSWKPADLYTAFCILSFRGNVSVEKVENNHVLKSLWKSLSQYNLEMKASNLDSLTLSRIASAVPFMLSAGGVNCVRNMTFNLETHLCNTTSPAILLSEEEYSKWLVWHKSFCAQMNISPELESKSARISRTQFTNGFINHDKRVKIRDFLKILHSKEDTEGVKIAKMMCSEIFSEHMKSASVNQDDTKWSKGPRLSSEV
jgi:hypothetical protein